MRAAWQTTRSEQDGPQVVRHFLETTQVPFDQERIALRVSCHAILDLIPDDGLQETFETLEELSAFYTPGTRITAPTTQRTIAASAIVQTQVQSTPELESD